MTHEIEPLDPILWFRRIEKVAKRELNGVENSLRHAMHLLQLTPRPLRPIVHLSVDEGAFERLLDAEEFDMAARHLVAQPTALAISDEAGGSVRADISCATLRRVVSGRGESVAWAVLDAWTRCLLAIRAEFGDDLRKLTDPPSHDDLSEQRRQPS